MSIERFKAEISGEIDRAFAERKGEPNNHFWQRHAEAEVKWVLDKYENGELLIDENGVATWKSNNNALPKECAYKGKYGGLPINLELTAELEERQTRESINAYRERMKNHKYTEEELWEMRAAFGEGTTVVDALTGRRIQL